LCIFWFRVRLLWVRQSNHPFSQTQLVEMVTWQVRYI